jgi:hypothetical protein
MCAQARDARDLAIRRRHADLQPEPMFEMPAGASVEPTPKPRAPRVVARRGCPVCGQPNIPIVLDGNMLSGWLRVFRPHDRMTYGGVRFPCAGSGRPAP